MDCKTRICCRAMRPATARHGRMAKHRADQLLVDRGLAESRARAQALILAGLVFSGERKIDKAGQTLRRRRAARGARASEHPWVSRGGIKLAHALDHFGWDVAGAVALDVGSSTGGFTDVLLQRGAAKVFAVDVGTNQLAWKLRQDPRVDRPRADQCALSDRRDRHRAGRPHRLRRQLHLARQGARPGARLRQARRRAWSRWSSRSSRRSGARSARAASSATPPCTSGSAPQRPTGWRCAAGRSRGSSRARSPAPKAMSNSCSATAVARRTRGSSLPFLCQIPTMSTPARQPYRSIRGA